MDFELTADLLSQAVGVALSLLFAYFPGLNAWYNQRDSTQKRQIMLLVLAIASGLIYAGACTGLTDAVSCDQAGLLTLGRILLQVVIANQVTHRIAVPGGSGGNDGGTA